MLCNVHVMQVRRAPSNKSKCRNALTNQAYLIFIVTPLPVKSTPKSAYIRDIIAKIGQNRLNYANIFRFQCQKVHRLEKSTPPPVVTNQLWNQSSPGRSIRVRDKQCFVNSRKPICLPLRCARSHNSLRGIQTVTHLSPHILLRGASAHSNSVQTFPNNIYIGMLATV